MRQRDKQAPQSAEQTVRDIRRVTRRHFSAEEKIRIVFKGLRGEDSVAACGSIALWFVIWSAVRLIDLIGCGRQRDFGISDRLPLRYALKSCRLGSLGSRCLERSGCRLRREGDADQRRGVIGLLLCFGQIWTPLQVSGGQPTSALPTFGLGTPMGRPGQPAELAPLYVLLASNGSSYSTG